jgi:hypothetical protein
MVVVPPNTPVTIPVPVPTVATVVVLLVHLPPVVPSLRVLVCPAHMLVIPVIGNGLAFTVITELVIQPAPSE